VECVHELFAKIVEKYPNNDALRYNGESVTYKELWQSASQVALTLQSKGCGVGDFVPLMVDRSVDMMVGMLGVMMAGCAYCPFAPYMPADRLSFMAKDCAAKVVLCGEKHHDLASTLGAEVVRLGTDDVMPAAGQQYKLPQMKQTDHMMCLYTSGSTGTPKAVALGHQAVLSHLYYIINDYEYNASDKYLQSVSFTFVASLPELFGVLMVGGCVVLADPHALLDMEEMADYMEDEECSLAQFIPSVMSSFLEQAKLTCPKLRAIVLTGEPLPRALLEKVTEHRPDILWLNHYGCTEVTDTTCVFKQQGPLTAQFKAVPVGKPVRHRIALILDARQQPVPIGVPGELWAVGVGLATEYLKRPELTEEKFPRDICGHARAYATGDLCRWKHNGEMECMGRMDFQVKVNGLRIELGEIEGVVVKHTDVNEAAVLLQDLQLVAYVSPPPADGGASILEHCRSMLPGYMVPVAVIGMAEWPRNANGKLDRKMLPKWEPSAASDLDSSEFQAPSTPAEIQLAALWEKVLSLESGTISRKHSLVQVGGQSLLAARVVAAVRREMGTSLSVYDLLKAEATLSVVAIQITDGRGVAAESAVAALPEVVSVYQVGVDKDKKYPAAASQEQMYVLWNMDPEAAAYNENEAMHIRGPVCMDSLRAAVRMVSAPSPQLAAPERSQPTDSSSGALAAHRQQRRSAPSPQIAALERSQPTDSSVGALAAHR
jgi:amino acid adenylation domain-containing protein